jgi:hypothetical protein
MSSLVKLPAERMSQLRPIFGTKLRSKRTGTAPHSTAPYRLKCTSSSFEEFKPERKGEGTQKMDFVVILTIHSIVYSLPVRPGALCSTYPGKTL